MKREICRILMFIASVIVISVFLDFGIGKTFDYLITRMPSDGERVAKSYYAFNKVDSDILIVGSSRAETGYDCRVFTDSLPSYSFFNCGGDGQDFYYCNTLINSIFDRYTPKAIIWDFKEQQLSGGDEEDLSLIYPYYWGNHYVHDVLIDREGWSFKIKMLVNSYRYNATAGRIIRSILFPNKSAQNTMGFGGRSVTAKSITILPQDFIISEGEINIDKREAFIATAKRAKDLGCKLFVVISPMFNVYNQDNIFTRETARICLENDVVFIDDSHLEGYAHNNEIAYDNYHLNVVGALRFSIVLSGQLQPYLEKGD